MITDAIGLYKELNEYEKVGDLYMLQQKKETAFEYYQIVADDYIAHDKYVKASLLYKNKMENTESAQEFLLKGWRHQKDAFNCINNYFPYAYSNCLIFLLLVLQRRQKNGFIMVVSFFLIHILNRLQ